jgi:hypothetical protein
MTQRLEGDETAVPGPFDRPDPGGAEYSNYVNPFAVATKAS